MSEHAISNARGWIRNIKELVSALDADDEDAARERISESPLSVRVRDGWRDPGAPSDGAEEFEILLSTGGPALRIVGDLEDDEPDNPRLEWQDWGTPWTRHDLERGEVAALLDYCRCFYFGS